jgi:hypothetical protein
MRRAAVSGVMLRGLFSKKTKPRNAAPPSKAAFTVSGVDSPQILAVVMVRGVTCGEGKRQAQGF